MTPRKPAGLLLVMRRVLRKRYGLSDRQVSDLGWRDIVQSDRCKDEDSRLLLLGIKRK